MICIINQRRDPYYNLAFEEYILKNFDTTEDILILWQNRNTIVVGRHQNTVEEVNAGKVKELGVNVVRRLSGGGAVYHDDGNINFTFITGSDKQNVNNYRKFTEPIIKVLNDLAVPASFSGRNDIVIEGKKISGNAQYYYKDRMFHHGTILFDVDMSILGEVLKVDDLKIQSKSVKSVRSRVTNIKPYLKTPMTTAEFMNLLKEKLLMDGQEYKVDNQVIETVEELADSKYRTWAWNYGKSPEYDMVKKKKYNGGILDIRLNISQGRIDDMIIYGDFLSGRSLDQLTKRLIGQDFNEKTIRKQLTDFDLVDYLGTITAEEVIDCLFY